MTNEETFKMIAGLLVSIPIILFMLHLCCSRKMTAVHGTVEKKNIGLIRAIFTLIHMYYFGYSNTLFVNTNKVVKVHQDEREMRKNKPPKSVMVFEVWL